MQKDRSIKRQLITFNRLFITGVTNLFRNAWLSVAAMAVMFVALGILLFSVVLNITTGNAITELSRSLKVSIYLEDTVADADRFVLQEALAASEYTADIEYVSKDDAQARFTESFQNDQELIEGLQLVGDDSLPASYEVSATSLDDFNEIEEIALRSDFDGTVESITLGRTDARRTIERAASAQQFITTSSVFAVLVFTIISVLIIFNTIRIAIFTRSEEIKNMKLIGATPWYIRGPFLVEASIYGVIAGVLATITVYAIVVSVGSGLASQAEFQETYELLTAPLSVVIAGVVTVLAGIVVGIFSSSLAISKYLRLKHW